MIVANMTGQNVEEVIADKAFTEKHSSVTMPILNVDDNTWISDSNAIVSYLVRSSPKSSLLGGSEFEQA